jgi:hypothetical protein
MSIFTIKNSIETPTSSEDKMILLAITSNYFFYTISHALIGDSPNIKVLSLEIGLHENLPPRIARATKSGAKPKVSTPFIPLESNSLGGEA